MPVRPGFPIRILAVLLAGVALGAQAPEAPALPSHAPIFYRELDYGSEASFTPFQSALNWIFDTVQVPISFKEEDFGGHWNEVRWDLTHPRRAVENRGGWGAFIDRQIFPYQLAHGPDWLPNYGLHLLGGGMLYRKRAEWFEAHDVPLPRLASGLLSLTEELAAETIEKYSTLQDDEVADVLVFLPASILLFSSDTVAHYAADELDLLDWPHQIMVDPSVQRPWGARGRVVNAGQNFAVRPRFLGGEDNRFFVYMGMTNLAGVSHRLNATDSLSWGLGAAMVKSQEPTRIRAAGGLFWDRNGSLLASLLLHATDELAVRINVYPGVLGAHARWSPGLYLGIGDHGDLSAGITFRMLPFGGARIAPRTGR